ERQLTGVEPERLGNADPDMVPHGVYACRGQAEAVARDEDDAPCWVAIACRDDDDWRRLCRVVGSGLDPDLRFERRLARRQQIDEALAGWCAQREAAEAARQLLDYGVPAHRVQNSRQLLDDEHLRARGHWVVLPHPEVGRITIEGPRAHLSETPGRPRTCAPFLGQHVVEVVTGLAGFTEDEFAELVARGALGE